MQRTNTKPSRQLAWIEQAAVLATSLVWTAIILLVITFFWAYQDAQARWEMLQTQPTSALIAVSQPATPILLPTNTVTPTPSPAPSPTPTSTNSPTPTATYVLGPAGIPPQVLPETPLEGEATPTLAVSVEITTEPVAVPTATPIPLPTSTPTPEPPQPPAANSGPTRVLIKSVGIDTPVVPVGWSVIEQNGKQYSVWDVADFVAGWHKTSAPPGQPGNTVLSGHHNIKGEVFRYLVDVQEGDEVVLYVGDIPYRYYVEQKLIVKEKGEPVEVRRQNAQWIAPTNDVRVTMVTCWPYTNNTHRVIVVAKPAS